MPKVGIVTFHRSTNFGSYLQTYGLYRKIADLGCECEVIDYRCPAIEAREGLENKINGPKDLAKRLLLGPGINRKKRALGAFANENMSFSRPFFPKIYPRLPMSMTSSLPVPILSGAGTLPKMIVLTSLILLGKKPRRLRSHLPWVATRSVPMMQKSGDFLATWTVSQSGRMVPLTG